MRKATYLVVLSSLITILLLVSCTNPVKKDIFINISLTGEAENINYSKFSTTPASFEDNIVVNKYKVYLYQNGTEVYQQESTNVSNNTISLHLTTINSGTYTLRVEAFNDTTPIFYGEEVVQLSYGQNNTQLATYFNKARLTVNVQNQAEGFELTGLSIKGTLPATPTNNFVENKTFQNKEIYPGVWHIDLEATMTSDSSSVRVTYPTKIYEIYPSEDKVLNFVIKRDDLGNVYIDLLTEIELPYLEKVWNMKAERNENGLKLMWDYDLPAMFNIYRGDGYKIDFIWSTTQKYFVDTNPVSSKNHYYVNAIYGGKESGLCELVVDLQSPQVTIINLTNGTIVRGLVTITAEAQDNVGVSKVEFYIDGTKVGEDTVKPYQYDWNTELTNDSTHTIQAKAYDIIGNTGQSNIVTVKVANVKPEVRIVSPTNGETLHGTVTILAEVQDDEGIAQVEFFANDKLVKGVISPPYEYAWNTSEIIDGTYILKAKATNLSGNQNSESINVIVNNGQKVFEGALSYSVNQTTDGGYIVAGYTWSFGTVGYDVYVLKLNSDGSLAWQKTFGGSGRDCAYSIQQTADGGYIVAGVTTSFGAGHEDAYVLKLNSDGSLAWQKTFGGSYYDYAYSVKQTTDGGYIVAGYTNSFGAGYNDVYVLKLNSDGSLAWQKTFGENGYDEAYSVQETTDGGYIVAGYTKSFGAGGYDVYILKLNSNGTLIWQETFEGSSAYSIQQTTDGGYIVAGYTGDAYVLKLNSDGSLAWQKTFGGAGVDYAYSIQQTTDGGYIVAGYTNSFGAGYEDVYILKLNSDGSLAWQKTFGGNGYDEARSIQQTTDGGYIVAGYTTSPGGLYILKLDSNGELHPFE